jgi:hypothetical protein
MSPFLPFEPIFAWSWDGHGRLTALAVAVAISQLIRPGKADLMKRFLRLSRDYIQFLGGGGRTRNLYENVDQDPVPPADQIERALKVVPEAA